MGKGMEKGEGRGRDGGKEKGGLAIWVQGGYTPLGVSR